MVHPDRRRTPPEPLPVSMRPVFLVGLVAWLIGLVGTTVLWAADNAPARAVWTCAVGAALGVLGLIWVRLRTPTPHPVAE